MPRFVRISPKEWCFGQNIRGKRRHRLLRGSGFAGIVRDIVRQAIILSYKRRRIRDYPDYYRFEVTLKVASRTPDLFHNSAAGYRAQYYRSVKLGEVANKYAVRQLAQSILKRLEGETKRTCPIWWAKKSILHSEAKLWIHQGRWLLIAQLSDRNLLVTRWLKSKPSEGRRRLWATLTPSSEFRIDLKGAPLTLVGEPLSTSLKPKRSLDIRAAGYT